MVMETTGLIFKYKVDRPLRFEERHGCLKQKQRLDVLPTPYLSTVRLNSTYLEMVGKFYEAKGFLTVVMLVCVMMGIGFVGGGGVLAYMAVSENDFVVLVIAIFATLLAAVTLLASIWTFFRECFRLTHFPIRLNRKLRKLYAMDPYLLKVIEADWDKMVFVLEKCLHAPMRITQWEILGHVLDEDGQTVRATLPFSFYWPDEGSVKQHWEYMRRYMEEGPEAIMDHTPVCLPLHEGKESFGFGYRMVMHHHVFFIWAIIATPLIFVEALGRYLAMQTSDIPRWSKRIEEECQIDPGDPYAIDANDNPPDFWKATAKRRSELEASRGLPR
jgi:hypothetical protein